MKNAVIARPNLKMLLLGAILIALVQNFMVNPTSQATPLHARSPSKTEAGADPTLQHLFAQAEESPDSQLYMEISQQFEKRGEMKKALAYLRKAQLISQIEEANE